MRKPVTAVATVLAALACTIASTATPASADVSPGPAATMKISITPLYVSPAPAPPLTATLRCEPPGGTHPYAAEACADIAAAKGDIAAIPPQPPAACLAVWLPVEIAVHGTWRGAAIDFTETQQNLSCARISHGYVFTL